MSNNGIPPLNDYQSDNYPVIYDEGDETSYYVKSGNKHAITGGGSSYLVYVVSVSQTGTGDLTIYATFENTIGTIYVTRISAGYFTFTSANLFTIGKTWIPNTDNSGYACYPISSSAANAEFYIMKQTGSDTIELQFYNASYNNVDQSTLFGDGFILNLPEIRVYP